MAILTTLEFDGVYPFPAVCEAGEVYEVNFEIDSATTNLGVGDFVQLCYIPNEAVVTEVALGTSATAGSTTLELGIADALVTTDIATPYLAAATHTDTTVRSAQIMNDAALAAHTADQRILALAVAAEAESTVKVWVKLRYRAARNGR